MSGLQTIVSMVRSRQPRTGRSCRVMMPAIGGLTLFLGICLADETRFAPPKDLNGFFPFTPPASADAWPRRADDVRRRVLVSQGLWPAPTKSPLNPVIHGTITIADEAAPGVHVSVAVVVVVAPLLLPQATAAAAAPSWWKKTASRSSSTSSKSTPSVSKSASPPPPWSPAS